MAKNVLIAILLFFSLDQPVTKNQLLFTKSQLKFLVVVSIRKEKRTAWLLLFWNGNDNKKLWLTFNVYILGFLVSRSNEKNINVCTMYKCISEKATSFGKRSPLLPLPLYCSVTMFKNRS